MVGKFKFGKMIRGQRFDAICFKAIDAAAKRQFHGINIILAKLRPGIPQLRRYQWDCPGGSLTTKRASPKTAILDWR
jgi:hypothetical protein